MRAKLHFPKRKVVEGRKVGQEGKRQLIQGCYLAGSGTEAYPRSSCSFHFTMLPRNIQNHSILRSFLGSTVFLIIWPVEYFMTSHFTCERLRTTLLMVKVEFICLFRCNFVCQRAWRLYICPLYFF